MKLNFRKKLIDWYSVNKRELPWRETREPYFIWLSEIILQQTQVRQGLPYYLSFAETFPTVWDLARASEDEVLKLWQGLGYYSRARNLHKTAQLVCGKYHGEFPDSYTELLKLPGVGDYTASAIASICYDAPTAVVDGNVYRFYSRFFGIKTPINSAGAKKEFKSLAQEMLPGSDTGNFNQAVMEFGARQCRPKSPDCEVCVFERDCKSRKLGMVNILPVKTKRQKIRNRYFNYIVVRSVQNRKVLLSRRDKPDIWQNLYEFPLIESDRPIEKSADLPEDDIIKITDVSNFNTTLYNPKDIVHKLSHQHIHAKFWIVETDSILDRGIEPYSLESYPVPVLIQDFMEEYGLIE